MDNKTTIEERQEREKQAVLEILREMPIINFACKKANISRATYYRWVELDSDFLEQSQDAMAIGVEYINDLTEIQIINLIKDKKMPAMSLWLKFNNPKYGAGIKGQRVNTIGQGISQDNAQYQKFKKVAEHYEEILRKTIIDEINEN